MQAHRDNGPLWRRYPVNGQAEGREYRARLGERHAAARELKSTVSKSFDAGAAVVQKLVHATGLTRLRRCAR